MFGLAGVNLLALSLLAWANSVQEEFVAQAAANNGHLKLDSDSFDLLTAPDREWSATIQLTALGVRAPLIYYDLN